MKTFGMVLYNEIRLAWRRRSFWVVQLLWLLPILLDFVLGPRSASGETNFVANAIEALISFEFLLLPLIVGPALLRDLGEPGELVWTTPLGAATHLAAVLCGLLLALLPLLVAQLAVRWLLPTLLWDYSAALLLWPYGLPLVIVSTLVAIAIVALLTFLLRRLLLLLLASVGLWFGTIALLSRLTTTSANPLDSPLNLLFNGLELSPSVGLGLSRPLVLGLAGWLVGLGALLAMAALGTALWRDHRRTLAHPRLTGGATLVALLLALSGFVLHTRAVQAQTPPPSPYHNQQDGWQVLRHEMAVEVGTDSLRGRATLYLAPAGRAMRGQKLIVLRLNPGMTPTAVAGEAGPLEYVRAGDSILVTLPQAPSIPFILHLAWEGTPQPAYADYGSGVGFHWPAYTTPQPIRGLLTAGVGYLMRDGDWHPWPWSTQPHQAGETHVTLRTTRPNALSAAPLHEGEVEWNDRLPAIFLALPPPAQMKVGPIILHRGAWTGPVLNRHLRHFAELAPQLASVLGQPVPRHMVVMPYLSDMVWSGELLLIPEGTGYRPYAFFNMFRAADSPAIEARAKLTALAQDWLKASLAPTPTGFVWVEPGEASFTLQGAPHDPGNGRWIPALEGMLAPSPKAELQGAVPLSSPEPLNDIALWLAIELAEPTVRADDLALLRAVAEPVAGEGDGESWLAQSSQLQERLLPVPSLLEDGYDPALVVALDQWTERVGRERALRLVGEAVQGEALSATGLLVRLEEVSGVPFEGVDFQR